MLGAIEKAITKSDIGLMPNVDGTVVRLNIPPLTEERRKDLVKVVHKRMEEARVEIRNLRRDAADHLKKEERDGDVGADEAHRQLDQLQKTTDRYIAEVDRRRRRQGTGGPRGLVARAPLARPTDAPPSGARADGEPTAPARPAGEPAPTASCPPEDLPRHVAIIMDGNRRWARQHDLSELEGHAAGVEAIRGLLRHAVRRGVPVLTLYAFSRENWARSDDEVRGLFAPPRGGDPQRDDRAAAAGRPGPPPRPGRRAARRDPDARSATPSTRPPTATRLLLNIAFNYAGRTELVDAVRRLAASGVATRRRSTRRRSRDALYTAGLPDPDLVIRTGGEQRLSNFLIWQSAYAEFYFCRGPVAGLRPGRVRRGAARVRQPDRRFGR